ncbi:MAG: hypothetical protein NZM26_04800 [Patescibacteria group bacterium]|nr:hypothetical protein [Patescibacteria group bacterium]
MNKERDKQLDNTGSSSTQASGGEGCSQYNPDGYKEIKIIRVLEAETGLTREKIIQILEAATSLTREESSSLPEMTRRLMGSINVKCNNFPMSDKNILDDNSGGDTSSQ